MAAVVTAFLIWGLFPFYWKALQGVGAEELVAHRLVWSLGLLLPLVWSRGAGTELRAALGNRRLLLRHLVSGALLAGNWTIYVWAVHAGHVVDASLGYFLVPLLNAALGVVVLRERLPRLQVAALLVAALGVGVSIVGFGGIPWTALGLAATWGSYTLLRKQSPLGSLTGLALETLLWLPLAVGLLVWWEIRGVAAFGRVGPGTTALILGTGVVTAGPLLLFAYGARMIALTTVGLLQYIVPSVQFAIGVLVYREAFPPGRGLSFAFIWLALVIYSWSGLRAARRSGGEAGPHGAASPKA